MGLSSQDKSIEWLKCKAVLPSGLIGRIRQSILETMPVNPEWAESIAVGLASSVSQYAWTRTEWGETLLNECFLLIGKSGLAIKSAPLNNIGWPMIKLVEEAVGTSLLIPSDYTVESLVKEFSKKDEQGHQVYRGGLWIRDEFGGVFKNLRKDYNASMLDKLSEFIDGHAQSKITIERGEESAEKVFMSILGATTESVFEQWNDENGREFFRQGTGNRILYIYDMQGDTNFHPIRLDRTTGKSQLDQKIEYLAEYLKSIYLEHIGGPLTANESVETAWNDYRKLIHERKLAMEGDPNRNLKVSYVDRLPMHALKMAFLHQIGRAVMTPTGLRNMNVDLDDLRWAVGKAERHWDHFQAMTYDWLKTRDAAPIKRMTRHFDEILAAVRSTEDKMMTQAEIVVCTGFSRGQAFRDWLDTLVTSGKLELIEANVVKTFSPEVRERHHIKPEKVAALYKYIEPIEKPEKVSKESEMELGTLGPKDTLDRKSEAPLSESVGDGGSEGPKVPSIPIKMPT